MSVIIGQEQFYLADKKITIDGENIPITTINEIEIYWDINEIMTTGLIKFYDVGDTIDKLTSKGIKEIEFNFADRDSNKWNQTFIITEIYQSLDHKSRKGIACKFIDKFTYKSLNLYAIKGWEEITADMIIDDVETMKDHFEKDFKKDFTPPKLKYKNFVIPVNRPFSQVINYLKNTSNFLFFQTRESYKITEYKKLFGESPKKDKFLVETDNPKYAYKIFGFDNKYVDKFEANLLLPKTKSYSYDIKKKNKKYTDYDTKLMITDIKGLGKTELSIDDTLNEKHFVKVDLSVEDEIKSQYFRNGHRLITAELLVGGMLTTNIGEVITIEINTGDKEKLDSNISGDWLIIEIVDKHVAGDFFQKLTIAKTKLG